MPAPMADTTIHSYLGIFSLLIFAHIFIVLFLVIFYNYRTIAASRAIHANLMNSVFGSTFRFVIDSYSTIISFPYWQYRIRCHRWLDETPVGRIIARCTQDIRTIDTNAPQSFLSVMDQCIGLITKLGVIVLFTPIFIFPGIAIAIVGTVIGSMYLRAQLSIKREMRYEGQFLNMFYALYSLLQQCSVAVARSFQCRNSWSGYVTTSSP